MKLSERPLEWWRGKKYAYWCRADKNDDRKINYTVNHKSIGKGPRVFTFTSDDMVSWDMMYYLRTGYIKDLRMENNEWFVEIDAGIIPPKKGARK